MHTLPIQDVSFDDHTTVAMGIAFERACSSLRSFAHDAIARELIAKRIIEAAKNGERDAIQLCAKATVGFCIDYGSVPNVGGACDASCRTVR